MPPPPATPMTPPPSSSTAMSSPSSVLPPVLSVMAKSSGKTSSEHVVRSRVLLSPKDMEKLHISNGTPVMVDFSSVEKKNKQQMVAEAWRLTSLTPGKGMLTDVVATEQQQIHLPEQRLMISKVAHIVRATRVVLNDLSPHTSEFTTETLRYLAFEFMGSVVSLGTELGVKLGGKLHVMVVMEVISSHDEESHPPSNAFSLHVDTQYAMMSTTSNSSVQAQPTRIPFVGMNSLLTSFISTVTTFFSSSIRDKLSPYKLIPPRGILVYGTSGSGKTHLVRHGLAMLELPQVTIIEISKQDMTRNRLSNMLLASARSNQDTILFVDDCDESCPSRHDNVPSSSTSMVTENITSTLLTLLDSTQHHLFLVCTAKSPELIDKALRRPGRLDEEMEIAPPNAIQRTDILSVHVEAIAGQHHHRATNVQAIAERAHGFVAADLVMLVRDAWRRCLVRDKSSRILQNEDLDAALVAISPSALREVVVEVPKVRWNDIGGMEHVKRIIRECVELPLKHPEAFLRLGIQPPSGVLLYGPPGCSKTLMAKCVATESDMNFVAVKGPELLSKWVGDSEKAVQATFRRARAASPCVVFFDEIDALAGSRDEDSAAGVSARVLSQLLQEMDGVRERGTVIVLCATNRPDLLDKALLRPGRMDRLVYVPPPDHKARLEIIKIHMRNIPLGQDLRDAMMQHGDDDDQWFRNLRTDGFSGAEVASVVREASLLAIEDGCEELLMSHLVQAAGAIKPQITSQMLEFYEEFARHHQSSSSG